MELLGFPDQSKRPAVLSSTADEVHDYNRGKVPVRDTPATNGPWSLSLLNTPQSTDVLFLPCSTPDEFCQALPNKDCSGAGGVSGCSLQAGRVGHAEALHAVNAAVLVHYRAGPFGDPKLHAAARMDGYSQLRASIH